MKKSVQFIDNSYVRLIKKRKSYQRLYTLRLYAIKFLPTIITMPIFDSILISLIFGVVWWIISTMLFDHRMIDFFKPQISIWFGVPGSGKTTMCAWLTKHSLKAKYNVLSNVHIDGAYKLDTNDLGKYDTSFDGDGAHIIIDEAMISGLYNRNFKSFAQSSLPLYFSLHRHMNNRVDVFSQGYDIDLNVKQRAGKSGLFHLQRLPFKGFIMYRRIDKVLFIKKDDKQFVDGFKYGGLPRICFVKYLWNSFDTMDMSQCPKEQKEWKLWED